MARPRQIDCIFEAARPLTDDGRIGVRLEFRVNQLRVDADTIEDKAELGPDLSISAVDGIGKVMRILRAARISAPRELLDWVGEVDMAIALLTRARGTRVKLAVRARSDISFVAWTEAGVETVKNVADVRELGNAYVIERQGGGFPVLVPRDGLVRHSTEAERWYEVLDIRPA